MANLVHHTVLSLIFIVIRDSHIICKSEEYDSPFNRQFFLLGFHFKKCQLLPLLPGELLYVSPFARRW